MNLKPKLETGNRCDVHVDCVKCTYLILALYDTIDLSVRILLVGACICACICVCILNGYGYGVSQLVSRYYVYILNVLIFKLVLISSLFLFFFFTVRMLHVYRPTLK